MTRFVIPEPVRPGDTIAVVAPSSPFGAEDFWRGLAWLRDRYRIVASPSILARDGYLAGSDARRRSELVRAMTYPDVRAIVAARGGFGATRIVHDLPWDEFVRAPRWIVGFSDITALHVRATSLGVASIHAPHVTGLGRAASPTRAAFLRALERPEAPFAWKDLRAVHPGRARGPVVGGNLSMLYAMAASGALEIPSGAVLAIEDVTERPYRVDRMLTALLASGQLARASAVVFGGFTSCEAGIDGVSIDAVIFERTARLGIPVVAGAPFGHDDHNEAFVFGREVEIESQLRGSGGGMVRTLGFFSSSGSSSSTSSTRSSTSIGSLPAASSIGISA